MSTVFIGGSRHVSRLPSAFTVRIDNVMSGGHDVVVGDAAGADRAVQAYLAGASYARVTVFCSGAAHRNNVGRWATRAVPVTGKTTGFGFHAVKDREMAREADFGLMIWDGNSPGTVLNVLRLMRSGKMSVLFDVPRKRVATIKDENGWQDLLAGLSDEQRSGLRARATPDEWVAGLEAGLTISRDQPHATATV